jgi:2-(3-amino-3-carboxypropyl)histidine synthase
MKTFFIEARYKGKIEIPEAMIALLPKKISLFTTVQFIGCIPEVKKQLENKGKKVLLSTPDHARYKGQILGCSIKKFGKETDIGAADAFLYIGDGLFHPKALMLKNDKPVYIYNPFSEKYGRIYEKDVELLRKKQMGALNKFFASKEIGMLITTKPGQSKMRQAYALEEKYPDKRFYMLLSNTIDFSQLENYPFIECFVNTACPRIGYDDSEKIRRPVINIEELNDF